MPYRLTRAAADDIAALFLSGIERFGLTQADRYLAGLEAAFAFLAEFPRAARLRDEILPPVRAHPYRAHLILYDVESDDSIVIVRVRHGREDWQSEGG